MTLRLPPAFLGLVAALGLAAVATAQVKTRSGQAGPKGVARAEAPTGPSADAAKAKDTGKTERATFGGGCFWCSEAVFERIPGVKSVVSGYAGGSVAFPTYQMVGTGLTGHAEVVQVEFDPAVVSYETLLKVFWKAHDPTTLNRQGDDFGTQYRSIILYHDDAQKQAALKSYKDLTARRAYRRPIVTELAPMTAFFPAEAYHQDYYRHHRSSDYSQIYIAPKIRKMKP